MGRGLLIEKEVESRATATTSLEEEGISPRNPKRGKEL
jgi:hypothetical protein